MKDIITMLVFGGFILLGFLFGMSFNDAKHNEEIKKRITAQSKTASIIFFLKMNKHDIERQILRFKKTPCGSQWIEKQMDGYVFRTFKKNSL